MLNADQTITVAKTDGEAYTLTEITGVSWFDKLQLVMQGEGMKFANVTRIRIPAAATPAVLPEVGDIVVLGSVTGTPAKPADFAGYRTAKIMSVGDNRRGSLPHVSITCQ